MTPDRRGEDPLAALVAAVRASAKYRAVSPDLIAALGRGALARHRSLAGAVKETKSALHQAGGAYAGTRVHYESWLRRLTAAHALGDPAALRAACREVMGHHASTRERLGILDSFYTTTLAGLPPIRSVVDLACGLNPLAVPWMPLAEGATYRALDIYADLAAFLEAALPLLGIGGHAEVANIAGPAVEGHADLALVLKVLPVLEHQDRSAGPRLLRSLDASYLLVSFPVRSLGGRDKGMAEGYTRRFLALAGAEGWKVRQYLFATELAFLVERTAQA